MDDWLLLQLADSAFPTGGFAHSAGLEAQVQLGELSGASLGEALSAHVRQIGHAQLPFMSGAHAGDGRVDAACDAFLCGHVANEASRMQGRALASTASRVFELSSMATLFEQIRQRATPGHHAPVFGIVLSALGVELSRAQRLFLFTALRGATSAAVRLGIAGTHDAQRLQHALSPVLDAVAIECAALTAGHAANTAPRMELFGGLHDTLYARMFRS